MLMPMDQTKREQYLLYKMGMNLKWSLIALSSLILMVAASACTKVERTTETIYAPGTQSDATGTSSGGGGFTDTQAMGALKIAKYALAQIIENTSDEIFVDLPEDRNKEWLVNIIRNIEYRDVSESRYGRLLSFNYDLENEEVYVTREFVLTFSPLRLQVLSTEDKFSLITDLMMNILHEVSHFYRIGITQESDVNSDWWAEYVMSTALNEVYVCDNGKNLSMTIHRATGITHIRKHPGAGGFLNIKEGLSWSSLLPTGDFEVLDEWKENSFKSVYLLYVRLARQKFADEIPARTAVRFEDQYEIDGLGILDIEPDGDWIDVIPRKFPDHQEDTVSEKPGAEKVEEENPWETKSVDELAEFLIEQLKEGAEGPTKDDLPSRPKILPISQKNHNIVLSMARLPEFSEGKAVYAREYDPITSRPNREVISISNKKEFLIADPGFRLTAEYKRTEKDRYGNEIKVERKYRCDLHKNKLLTKPFVSDEVLTEDKYRLLLIELIDFSNP